MPTKEVATITPPQAVDLDAYRGSEWEDDGSGDIAPSFPIYKIVQATSSMKGSGQHGGEFFRSDTETFEGTLDIIPLFVKKTQTNFADEVDQPVCMSTDGIAPLPNMPLWSDNYQWPLLAKKKKYEDPGFVPATCEECPFSAWVDDAPPVCANSALLLAAIEPEGDGEPELVQMRIGGKSLKPWRQFIAKRLKPKKLPLLSHRLHLYTEEKTEPQKKWYELRIDGEPIPASLAASYNAILRAQRTRFDEAARQAASQDREDVGGDVAPDSGGWQTASEMAMPPVD